MPIPAKKPAPLSTAARHSSDHTEHHTPRTVVDLARDVLGGIDIDPASSKLANRVVKAGRHFTIQDNGFTREWRGRTFLNPPGGACDDEGCTIIPEKRDGKVVVREACTVTGACGLPPGHAHVGRHSSQKAWWFKLAREHRANRTTSAIFVCFSIELLQTTQVETPAGLPIPLAFPICFPARRVAYVSEQDGVLLPGGSPPHSSAIVFLPPRQGKEAAIQKFAERFGQLGAVVNVGGCNG